MLQRIGELYWKAYVREVEKELAQVRALEGMTGLVSGDAEAEIRQAGDRSQIVDRTRSWSSGVGRECRVILIFGGMEEGEERGNSRAKRRVVTRKGMSRELAEAELERLEDERARDLRIAKVVRNLTASREF